MFRCLSRCRCWLLCRRNRRNSRPFAILNKCSASTLYLTPSRNGLRDNFFRNVLEDSIPLTFTDCLDKPVVIIFVTFRHIVFTDYKFTCSANSDQYSVSGDIQNRNHCIAIVRVRILINPNFHRQRLEVTNHVCSSSAPSTDTPMISYLPSADDMGICSKMPPMPSRWSCAE